MISLLHCGRKFFPGLANGSELLLFLRHRDIDQKAVIGTNAYHIPVLELTTDQLHSIYKRTVPAPFVPDEQFVFQTYKTCMVAGHHWVVDHNVVRGATTDRPEISSFKAVFSYNEVLKPQFECERGGLRSRSFCVSWETATFMPREIRRVGKVGR
jgi:hypothetical protein